MKITKLESFYYDSEHFNTIVIQVPYTNKYYAKIYIHREEKIVETVGTLSELAKNINYVLNNTHLFSSFDYYGVD